MYIFQNIVLENKRRGKTLIKVRFFHDLISSYLHVFKSLRLFSKGLLRRVLTVYRKRSADNALLTATAADTRLDLVRRWLLNHPHPLSHLP